MKKQSILSLLFILSIILSACGIQQSDSSQVGKKGTNQTQQTEMKQSNAAQFPLTVTDEAGHRVEIPKQPQRIASVTEGTDEILSALVPKRKLALVTKISSNPQYSNITSWVKGIPQIKEANAEKIIAAKPDLVLLASYTKQGVVNQIEQAIIPVYEFNDFTSIDSIEKNMGVVGQLVGEEDKAKQMVQTMNKKIDAISNAVKNQKKLTILDYSSYGYAAGTNTTVNDIIEKAGGINAAKDLKGWQKISDEEIVKLNPDVIIVADSDKEFAKKIIGEATLQNVNAIKDKRVVAVSGAELSSVSQYVVNGVSDVAQALYPDVKLREK